MDYSVTEQFFFANKLTDLERWGQLDQKNNISYQGWVHSVSPLGRLNNSVTVYIPQVLSYVKCEVSAGYNSNYLGQTCDYHVGDKVLVEYVNGKSERPTITKSLSRYRNENYLLQEGTPIPSPDNSKAVASANAVIPDAAANAFQVSGYVHPLADNSVGVITAAYPNGNYAIYAPKDINLKAAAFNVSITAPPVDPVLQPYNEALALMDLWQLAEVSSSNYKFATDGTLTKDPTRPFIIQDPVAQIDLPFKPEDVIGVAQDSSEKFQQLGKCIANNANESSTFFDKVFDIQGGFVQGLLDELNNLLPSELQISNNGDVVNVGPLVINQKDGSIGFNGQVFSSAVDDQLSVINKQLPDFLGLTLTAKTLGIGDNTIYLEDLANNSPVQVGAFSVVQQGSDIVIKSGDTVLVNVSSSVQQLAQNAAVKPLNDLNQQLPEGLDVNVTFDKDRKPTFSIGPISISPSKIKLNKGSLGTFIESQVSTLLNPAVAQLSRPAQWLAQMAWQELDLGSLFLDTPTEQVTQSDINSVIKTAAYSCGVDLSITGTPAIVNPSDFTNATEYETLTNDPAQTTTT